jgi:hypothetical protein
VYVKGLCVVSLKGEKACVCRWDAESGKPLCPAEAPMDYKIDSRSLGRAPLISGHSGKMIKLAGEKNNANDQMRRLFLKSGFAAKGFKAGEGIYKALMEGVLVDSTLVYKCPLWICGCHFFPGDIIAFNETTCTAQFAADVRVRSIHEVADERMIVRHDCRTMDDAVTDDNEDAFDVPNRDDKRLIKNLKRQVARETARRKSETGDLQRQLNEYKKRKPPKVLKKRKTSRDDDDDDDADDADDDDDDDDAAEDDDGDDDNDDDRGNEDDDSDGDDEEDDDDNDEDGERTHEAKNNSYHKLRLAVQKLFENADFEFTMSCWYHVCAQASRPYDYQLVKDACCSGVNSRMVDHEGFIVAKPPDVSPRRIALFIGNVTRAICGQLITLFGTFQRKKYFIYEVEEIMKYSRSQQEAAGFFGFGLARSTRFKADKTLHVKYPLILEKFIAGLKIEEKMMIALEDDFSRRLSLTNYSSGSDKFRELKWIVNGIMSTPLPPVKSIKSIGDMPNYLRKVLSIDSAVQKIRNDVDYIRFPLHHIIRARPHLFNVQKDNSGINPFYFSDRALMERERPTLYSMTNQSHSMDAFALIDTISLSFHSYADALVSIMTTLSAPHMLSSLRKRNVVICPGDHPKQKHARKLIWQVLNVSPEYFSSLCKIADAKMYESLCQTARDDGVVEESLGKEIGLAATHLYQELGPLHIKINPPKDIFRTWFDLFFNPVYFAATGKPLSLTPPLREVHECVPICLFSFPFFFPFFFFFFFFFLLTFS